MLILRKLNFALQPPSSVLDPYSIDDATGELLTAIGSKIERGLLGDFLDAVDPHAINAGVIWVGRTVSHLKELQTEPHPIVEQFRKAIGEPIKARMPWDLGWEQGRRVRKVVGVDYEEPFDVGRLVILRVEPQEHRVHRSLQALGGMTTSGGHALIAGHQMNDVARRFATARALWHFATAPTRRFLLTMAHTDQQKVERAFAAELLAPASGVENFISDDYGVVYYDDLEKIGDHFGVAPIVIQHQVENQLELSVAD